MFDPFHNAVPPSSKHSFFPLVRDSWDNSWEGLPDYVHIVNWLPTDQSLDHFAKLGDWQLVAGFYDQDDWEAETKR